MAELFGFDETYYLNAKLNSIQGDPALSFITTAEDLKNYMLQQGLTPEMHYKQYGNSENINTSAYFNKVEYLTCKLLALRESAETSAEWTNKSIADLETVMAQAGMTPAEHYARYGYAETRADGTLLNPSNAFDANAYFSAKLAELQKVNPEQYAKATVADVVGIFQEQHLDPVSHYLNYGASEAIISNTPMVQTVPTSQRMPEDPTRAELGTLVPDNPSKPSLPPSKALPFEVPQPGDMGGHNYTTVLPPAEEPVPTPDIPGITPPSGGEEPKPEEPTPEDPKPEEPGGGSGSGGSGSGGSGGSGGDSGGGSGSGGSGGDSGGEGPDPSEPADRTIYLTDKNAVVTPLSSINAGGRYTDDNRNDTVVIQNSAAFNAIVDAGQYHYGSQSPENDTLILSVDMEGDPNWDDRVINLAVKNFESIVLGEGVQKVHPGDFGKYNNYELKNVTFDDKDDVLDLSGLDSRLKLESITVEEDGQGNILFQNYALSGGGTLSNAQVDFSEVQWLGGKLNSIEFAVTGVISLTIKNEDLAKIGSIMCSPSGYNYMNLKGEISAVDGEGQILDSNIESFWNLSLQDAKLAADVTSLQLDDQYGTVSMNTSQWKNLETLHSEKGMANLNLYHDNASLISDSDVLDKVLSANGITGFSSLQFTRMENLDSFDTTSSCAEHIFIDDVTLRSLIGKNIVGKPSQVLHVGVTRSADEWNTILGIKGFTDVSLDVACNDGDEFVIPHESSLETISFYCSNAQTTYGGTAKIVDKSAIDNTLFHNGIMSIATTGIEHIKGNRKTRIDISSFEDDSLQTVSCPELALCGSVTQDVIDAAARIVETEKINFVEAALVGETQTLNAEKYKAVVIKSSQISNIAFFNIEELRIEGADITTADLRGLKAVGMGGGEPDIVIEGRGGTLDLTGYQKNVRVENGFDTMIGGDSADSLWSRGACNQYGGPGNDGLSASLYGTQNGGAGNDSLSITASATPEGPVVQDGGDGNDSLWIYVSEYEYFKAGTAPYSMTGGKGFDSFRVTWSMGNVEGLAEDSSGAPDIRLVITDFEPTIPIGEAGTPGDDFYIDQDQPLPEYLHELLDISTIRGAYYTRNAYVGVASGGSAANLNQALQNAAKTITADKIGVFQFGDDTYLFGNNTYGAVDRGDLLIKLSGVDAADLSADNFVFFPS